MSDRATGWDLAVFDVANESLLATVQGARYQVVTTTEDGRPLTRSARTAQPVKREARVAALVTSLGTAPFRVSHLDVSQLQVGGAPLRAHLRRGTVRGEFDHAEGSGVGDAWRWPVLVERDFSAQLELAVPVTSVPLAAASHGALTNALVNLVMEINGVTVSLPMALTQWEHRWTMGDIQVVRAELSGVGPDTGTYPTSPTGSASLLARAMSQPEAPVAMEITSRASGGQTYAGNFMWEHFAFRVREGKLVQTEYGWRSQGPISAEATV